jgi:hypothetical protein
MFPAPETLAPFLTYYPISSVPFFKEIAMRFVWHIVAAASILLFSLSCSKDSHPPTRPEDVGQAVTLDYRSYYYHMGYYWNCIRLSLDDNPIERCELGSNSISLWKREYHWVLYIIDTRQEVETYIPVANGMVTVDREVTCVIQGNNVNWQ